MMFRRHIPDFPKKSLFTTENTEIFSLDLNKINQLIDFIKISVIFLAFSVPMGTACLRSVVKPVF